LVRPSAPPFLDVRTRRELEAIVDAARAAVDLAESQLKGSASNRELARANHERAEKLMSSGNISQRVFDEAITARTTAEAEHRQAEANLVLRQKELAAAEARLIEPDGDVDADVESCCVVVAAPTDGVVLDVLSESEQVLPAGAPLAEIGDPRKIEIVAHLLSSDAVRVTQGSKARLDDWGGESLDARVSRINPAAYTKVSALGIEEQRVDVMLDLIDPREPGIVLATSFASWCISRFGPTKTRCGCPSGRFSDAATNGWSIALSMGGPSSRRWS
jgi:HlyD family secretion protein